MKIKPDIVFIGQMGSGKSTLARYLATLYGYKMFSFAQALKDEVSDYLGRPVDKKIDREVLQKLGVERRKENSKYWINRTAETIQEYRQGSNELPVVIDDCRFINEAEWAKNELGALLIKISCDDWQRVRRLQDTLGSDVISIVESFGHISETELSEIVPHMSIKNQSDSDLLSAQFVLGQIVLSSMRRFVSKEE